MSNSVFEQRINGKKGKLVLFLIALAVLAMDVAVAVIAITSRIGFAHWIIPVVFATLDILLVPIIKFSNFRFKHSITFPIIYAITTVALSSLAAFLIGFNIFTTTAMIFFFLSHVLLVIALIFAIRNASCVKKGGAGFAWISALLFGAIAVMHISATIAGGFYGQGPISKYRSVEFKLDEGTDTYVAERVLPGIGAYANIPAEFKGKRVSQINAEILTDESVKYLELDCGASISFIPASGMEKSNTILLMNKEEVEIFRNNLTANAQFDDSYIALLNNVVPNMKDSDEIYITFSYTKESLIVADYNLIPTWYGNVGDTFDLALHADDVSYAKGYDLSSEEFLYRSYLNDAKIIRPLKSNDIEINKTRIQNAFEDVLVEFGNVYAVKFGEGNDGAHTLDDAFISFNNSGYRYVLDNDEGKLLSSVAKRDGFELSWAYSTGLLTEQEQKEADKYTFTRLSDVLNSDVTVYPVWTLKAPIINSLDADKGSYIYGDDVSFTSSATAPLSDLQLVYEWYFNGEKRSGASAYTEAGVFPNQSGVYTLKVTAKARDGYEYETTTLTSESTAEITVAIGKRPVAFNWNMTNGSYESGKITGVYSGTDKTISVELADPDNDVINGDFVSGMLDKTTIRNVNESGAVHLSINAEMSELYCVDGATTVLVEIAPYSLDVSWSNLTLVYNGMSQSPSVEAYGVGDDATTLISITVGGASINAVTDKTATATSNDTNYTVSSSTATQAYTINARPVTLNWAGNTTFEYNGLYQAPTVESISGAVDGEEATLLSTIAYSNKQRNVGSGYNVIASLADANYVISAGENCTFAITEREIAFNWDGSAIVYNGTAQRATATAVGVVSGDDVGITYSDYSGAIHAGTYSVTVSITNTNYKISTETETTKTYSIEKRPITLVWGASAFTYNAENQIPGVSNIVGAVTGEDTELLLGLVYTGEAKNVGSYEATASLASSENDYYIQNNANQSFTIAEKLLTLTWSAATSFVYNREAQSPTATIDGVIGSDIVNLALSDTSSHINVASYSVTASIDNDNYKLPNNTTRNYTITAKPLTITWDSITEFVYDGTAHTVGATLNGVISPDAVEIVYSNTSNNKAAGNYTVTASIENDNYSLTQGTRCNYTITPKAISVTWASSRTLVYNARAQYINATVNSGDLISGDTVLLSYTGYSNNKNVGEGYSVTAVSNNGNYSISNPTAEYSIIARTLTVSWEGVTSYVYNAAVQYPKATFGNTTANETVTPTYSNYNNKNVGSYTVSVSLNNSNYTLSGELSKSYSITQLELTLNWSNATFTYNGKAQAPTVAFTNKIPGDTVNPIYSSTSSNIDAGTYTVNVTGVSNSNYKLPTNASCEYKINAKTITVSWTGGNSFEYTGAAQAPVASLKGLVAGDNVAITYEYYKEGTKISSKPTEAGMYSVKVIITDSNYIISSGAIATFTIEEAPENDN